MAETKSFTEKSYTYKFTALHHKKLPYAVLYIKIDTTEKDLLFSLNCKFKSDKLLTVGTNTNNFMINCIAGTNGVVIYTPENRITNNVINYIKYLSTATVSAKQLYGTKGSYSKLLSSLKKVEVYVTGKCKTFIKNCILKESPKMTNMMKSIEMKKDKDRKDIEDEKYTPVFKSIEVDSSNIELLDILVSFDTKSLQVFKSGSKFIIKYLDKPDYSNYVGSIRGILKAFRGQDGACGSPASNDEGQKKYKAKCKEILESVNMVAFCISDVRGVSCKYSNTDDLKEVSSNSVKLITEIMKA